MIMAETLRWKITYKLLKLKLGIFVPDEDKLLDFLYENWEIGMGWLPYKKIPLSDKH